MIESMTSLAFSVYSGKGVYALLLGSGISRASGIMTGWDIVQDLIQKVAAAEGKTCGESPADWYESTYGKEPDYSDLLEMVAKTSAERGQLLRSYFEPSEQEREDGRKLPTAAHSAIARLISGGYIRVIVTTNFDRLLERALESEGVVPTVISTIDAVRGAPPLVHSRCTVIKVHGDYLDPRLKNTRAELAEYEEPMNRLLDQVFDEYGLIVCGWSADWDTALRAAIERNPNRRYTAFWSAYGEVKGMAQGVCQRRLAEVIAGKDADTFFVGLAEKVASLAEVAAQHPAATPIAVATLKRYLTEDRHRVRLEEFVMEEVTSAVSAVAGHPGQQYRANYDEETVGFFKACDAHFDRLLRLLIAGSYWGRRSQSRHWFRAVERVAQSTTPRPEEQVNSGVAIYPAILTFYACGIASLVGKRYATLARLLTTGRFKSHTLVAPLMVNLFELQVYVSFDTAARFNKLPNQSRSDLGLSPHLAGTLAVPFRDILPDRDQFEHALSRFEYINALVFVDWTAATDPNKISWTKEWAPSGLYTVDSAAVRETREEMTRLGARSPLLKAGLFGGSADRLQTAVELLNHHITLVRRGIGVFDL